MKNLFNRSVKMFDGNDEKIDRIIREGQNIIYKKNCEEALVVKYYGDMKFSEEAATNIMNEICGSKDEIPTFDREYPAIEFEDRTYTAIRVVIRSIIEGLNDGHDPFNVFMKSLKSSEADLWMETLMNIFTLKKEKEEYHSEKVQEKIKALHDIVKGKVSGSIFLFSMYNLYGAPGTETARKLDYTYGRDSAEFLYLAWRYYCINNAYNETDLDLLEDVYAIFYLADCKCAADSDDVQEYVRGFSIFLTLGVGICDEDELFKALNIAKDKLESLAYKDMYDGGEPRGIVWFFEKAIETYIKFLEFRDVVEKSLK